MAIEYHKPANTIAKKKKKAKGAEWAPVQVPTPPNQLTPSAGWYCFVFGIWCNQYARSSKQAVSLITRHCLVNRCGNITVSPFSAETFPISPSVLPLTFQLYLSLLSLLCPDWILFEFF